VFCKHFDGDSIEKERPISDTTDNSDTRVRVTIEKLVTGGDGLGRVGKSGEPVGHVQLEGQAKAEEQTQPAGQVVFVSDVVPGDTVEGRVVRRGRGRTVLEDVTIISPGPGRRRPPCRYVPVCGGCDWQHVEDGTQREWKRRILVENLQRIGKLSWSEKDIDIVSEEPFGYRSRIRIHRKNGQTGFFKRYSNAIVPIAECLVATDGINALLRGPRDDFQNGMTVVDTGSDTVRSDRDRTGTMDISGYPFRFAVGSFSQSNRKILTPLAKLLQEAVRPGRLVDIYAGAGLLAFMVLMGKSSFSSVLCVESDKRNAEFIRDNLSHVTSEDTAISVVIDTAERAIRKKNLMRTDRLTDGGVTTLVLDPPRGGLSSAVRTWLVRAGSVDRSVPDVAYLSCDSAALARDLAALAPRYRIESMTLLDFFPQTSHIETLVILRPHSR